MIRSSGVQARSTHLLAHQYAPRNDRTSHCAMTKREPILRAFARGNSIDRGQTNRLRAACLLSVFSHILMSRDRLYFLAIAAAIASASGSAPAQRAQSVRFELSFSPAVAAIAGRTLTGRAYVAVSRDETPEPRLQAGDLSRSTPFFGVDVNGLAPGGKVMVDGRAAGYPLPSLDALPAGDYWVQAVFSVYTEFHRSDGRTRLAAPGPVGGAAVESRRRAIW